MSDREIDSPRRFAAQVGGEIDRVFRGAMGSLRAHAGDLVRRHPPGFGDILIDCRTSLAWPDGFVAGPDYAEVTRYRDVEETEAALLAAIERGSITRGADGTIRATAAGHAFLDDLYATQGHALAPLWAAHGERVSRLAAQLPMIISLAAITGGGTFSAMAPPFEPRTSTADVLLLNRLSTMRYHRSDAHAEAWREAGLTAAEIVAMPPGVARDAIETRTNELAALPYHGMALDRRLRFLVDLRALPV